MLLVERICGGIFLHIEAVRGVYEKGLLFAGRIAVQVSEAAFDRGAEYRFGV